MSGKSGILYDSRFNTDSSANKLRHTYVKGYVDISGGDLNLQNGAFTMYNGLTSSAYFSIQNDGKFWITYDQQLMSVSLETLRLLRDVSAAGPTLGDIQIYTKGVRHNPTETDATEIIRGGLTIKGTRFRSDTYALFMSDVSINGILNAINDVSFNSRLSVSNDVSFNSKLAVRLDTSLNSRLFVNNDASFNSKLAVMLDTSLNSRLFVNNDVSFNSKLRVMLDVSLNSRLFVNNDVSFNSKLRVMLDVSLNSRLFVNNDASFNSKLTVGLDASLNSRLSVSNDVSFNSKLMVMQDVSLNSRLSVSNDVSFNSKLTVILDASLNSRLSVSNDVSFNSKLTVSLDTSLNSRLFVNNDVSFNSKLFVKNFVSIGKSLPLMSLDISYVDGIRLPTGTTNERPIKVVGTNSFQTQTGTTISVTDKSMYTGTIRYNTTNSQFEGFGPGDSWGSLGGVINVAQNTKISASSPNADSTNNELIFFTAPTGNVVTGAATERMRIAANGDISMNDKLFVKGDVSFNSNFTVVGNVKIDNTLTMKIEVYSNGGANQGAATIITPNTSIVEINGIGTSFNNYSLADGYFDGQTIKIVSDQLNASGLNLYGKLYFDQSLNRCDPIIFKNSYQSFDAIWAGGVWIVTAWNGVNFSNSNIMFGTSNSGDIEIIPAGKLYVNGRATIVNDVSFNSKLFVSNDVSLNSRLSVSNDASFNSKLAVRLDASLNSRLSVSNDVSFNSKLMVMLDASFNSRLSVSNDVSFNSKLAVMLDTSLNSRLSVSNDVSFNSKLAVMQDVSLNSRLFVNNDVSFNSKLRVMLDVSLNSRLFVNNDVSFNSKLAVMLDTSLNSRLSVSNDVSFNSKLSVMLDASLNSRLFVNNDVSFNSKLRVMLDVSLNSRLFVNNDASFNSKLTVGLDASLNSRLFVNNDASFNSKLAVMLDASFNSRLSVSNDVSFNSKLTVSLDTSLNSRLFVNNDVSFNSKLFVKNFVSIGKSSPLMSLDISYVDGIRLPTGTTNERPIKVVGTNSFQTQTGTTISVTDKSMYVGAIRYNTTNSQFEGFGPGDSWGSLGGVINVAQNTKISASSPNADSTNNELIFFTAPTGNLVTGAATERMRIAANGDISMNEKLFVRGDVSFNSRLHVSGNTLLNGDLSLNSNLYVKGDMQIKNASSITNDYLQIFQHTDNDFYIEPVFGNLYLGGGNANLLKLSANDATVNGELRSDNNIYAKKSLMIGQFAEMHETTPVYRFIFPFERNTINYGGSGIQLTFTSTYTSTPFVNFTYDTNCKIGNYSGRFTNGTTAKFLSSDIDFAAVSSGFSTCFWFKSDDITYNSRIIQFYNSASDKIDVFFNILNSSNYIAVQLNGSGVPVSNENVKIFANTWYHVGITISSTNVIIYVNGVSFSGTVNQLTNTQKKMYIGSNAENTIGLSGLNIDQLICGFSVISANDIVWIFKNKFELNVHNNLKLLTPLSAGFGSYTNLDFNNTSFNMGGIICTDLTPTNLVNGSYSPGTYITSMSFMLNYDNAVIEPMKITSTAKTGTNLANIQMNGNLTVEGNTAFTNLPTCSGTPTFNSQLATKAYVDSTVTASTSGSNTLTGLVVNGSTSDLNATVSISKNVGNFSDFIGVWQHKAQLQVQELNGNALALAMSTDGVGIIQGKKNGVGYNNISINPHLGNVGIGTFSPSYNLDVNGTASATRFIGKSGGVASHIAWHNATGAFNESSSAFYGIGTISDHMTFSANQTMAVAATTPSMKLSASGNLTAYGFKSLGNNSTAAATQPDFNGDGTSNHNLLLVSTKTPASTPYSMALGVDFATGVGYINVAGNSTIQPLCLQTRLGNGVAIGKTSITSGYELDVNGDVQATVYNALSDYRVKENIMILDASFNVDVLNPVTYNLKDSGKKDIGFIAHEVQEFYPFLVNGVKDGPITQSLNYNGLIGILTKEIKDLKKEMRLVRLELEAESKANTKLNSDVSVLRLKLEAESKANEKLNEDFSKLASEMSVLRDIVQELMPL